MARHSEAAFETVIEERLLRNGYVHAAGDGFDCERGIVLETVFACTRETWPGGGMEASPESASEDRPCVGFAGDPVGLY